MEKAVTKYIAEARSNLLNHNYGKAYAFYLLVLKLCPQYQNEVFGGFVAAWREWSTKLLEVQRIDDLFNMYEEGCEVFMHCDMLHFYMGNALHQLNLKFEAVGMFRKALLVNKHCYDAQISLENACRGLIDSWHFAMLNDKDRNNLFDIAISKIVKFNDIVLDIGSGTGILSMFAVKHGANKVYACEMSEPMQTVAKECIALNNMTDKIKLLSCYSNDLLVSSSQDENMKKSNKLLQQCSLVISETVDAGLLGEGIIESLNHAWKHLLLSPHDGGRVLPASATMYCAIVECDSIYRKHVLIGHNNLNGVLITSGVGIKDFTNHNSNKFKEKNCIVTVSTCQHEPYTSEGLKSLPHKFLSNEQKLFYVDFNNPVMIEALANNSFDNVSVAHHMTKSGYADAIVVWFELMLEPSTERINTSTGTKHCWDQAIYPIHTFKLQSSIVGNFDHANRLYVQEDVILQTNFEVKADCLFLSSVDECSKNGDYLKNCSSLNHQQNIHQDILHITSSEEHILRMNDSCFSNMYFHAICSYVSSLPCSCNILDISNGFNLLAIKVCKVLQVTMHKYCQTAEIQKAIEEICKQCGINIHCYNKITGGITTSLDLIVSDVIEPSGLLSLNAISNIHHAKSCLSGSGVVIPNQVTLIVQFVNSEDLLSKCLVVTNENTIGLKIAEAMNDFRVSVHSDLDTTMITYKALSKPECAMCYDFNRTTETNLLHIEKSLVIKITDCGNLHGVLFWFNINVCESSFIDTKDPSNHWKQAAFLFPSAERFSVNAKDEVVLKTICHNDSIIFNVSKFGA